MEPMGIAHVISCLDKLICRMLRDPWYLRRPGTAKASSYSLNSAAKPYGKSSSIVARSISKI